MYLIECVTAFAGITNPLNGRDSILARTSHRGSVTLRGKQRTVLFAKALGPLRYALGLPRSRTSTGSPLCTVSPSNPFHDEKSPRQTTRVRLGLFLAQREGFDSRANCALGLPQSRTSTGSPLCTVSPSNPFHDEKSPRQTTRVRLGLFWRRGRDSNPRVLLAQTDFESAPL